MPGSPPTSGPAPGPPARARSRRALLGPALLLLALTAAAFAPTLRNDFANLDDRTVIIDNTALHRGLTAGTVGWALTSTYASNWFPLTWLSLALDVRLFGLNPAGHHAMSVALHAAAALLAFALFRGMTGSPGRSLILAGLFAAHPLQVESVAWATERSNVLAGLLWFATLLAWLAYARRPGIARYLAAALLFALGLMAKPLVVTLPCVLLLLDFWPLGRVVLPGERRRGAALSPGAALLEKLPLFALAAGASAATFLIQRSVGAVSSLADLSLAARVRNALASCLRYLGKAAWPADLSPFYLHPGEGLGWGVAAAAALLLLALTAVALALLRRRPAAAVGWLWYLGTLVPVLGIVQAGSQAYADRFAYFSLAGVWTALLWSVPEPRSRAARRALAAAAAALLLVLAAAANGQSRLWRTPSSLAEHVLAREPGNWMARNDYANALAQRGSLDAAVRALLPAVAANPGMPYLRSNLASYLEARGDLDAAIHHLRRAADLSPLPEYRTRLEALLSRRVRTEGAAGYAAAALRADPRDAEALRSLGAAYIRLGRFPEAAAALERADALEPGRANVRFFLERARGHAALPEEELLRRGEGGEGRR